MKKLLFLLFIFSFSLACELPHEEVYGFKLGCPFEITDDLKVDSKRNNGKYITYLKELKDSYFDVAEVGIIDGKMVSIIFVKKILDGSDKRERNLLEAELLEKWGKPILISRIDPYMVDFNVTDNDVISVVSLYHFEEESALSVIKVMYSTKGLKAI